MVEAEERVNELQAEVEEEKRRRIKHEQDQLGKPLLLLHHRRQLDHLTQQLVNVINLKLAPAATSSGHVTDRKSLVREMEAIGEELRKMQASLSLPDEVRLHPCCCCCWDKLFTRVLLKTLTFSKPAGKNFLRADLCFRKLCKILA